MNRRMLLLAAARVGASAAGLVLFGGCGPLPSKETRPARVVRVGILSGSPAIGLATYGAFRDGLRELGWVEGQNVAFEPRSADGDNDAFPALAAALVDLPVDVIVTGASTGAVAAKQATSTIPIVMTGIQEPVTLGLVASLARPGANVTGLSRLTTQLAAKRLELLKQVIPGLVRVAVLWDTSPAAALNLSETQAAASGLGLLVQPLAVNVKSADGLEAAFAAASRERAEALVFQGGLFQGRRLRIAELVARARLPSMHADRGYVEAGGLVSYGEDLVDLWRRSASYVDKILRGAKPAELPIEEPSKFELVVNRSTAQALELTIPPSVAAQVTDWI